MNRGRGGASPRGSGRWLINPESTKSVEAIFKYQASLCELLGTNVPMWKKMTVGEGAKKNIVENVIWAFLHLLHQRSSEGFRDDHHVRGLVARSKFAQYSDVIDSGDCSSLMYEIEE